MDHELFTRRYWKIVGLRAARAAVVCVVFGVLLKLLSGHEIWSPFALIGFLFGTVAVWTRIGKWIDGKERLRCEDRLGE